MLALIIMTAAAVLIPAACVGLISLYIDASETDGDSDRAASLAEFFPVHKNGDKL